MVKKSILFLGLTISCCASLMASNAWNEKTHFGGVGRHRGTGIAIGTKGYMGLGHYNGTGVNYLFADWWEFDPSSNSWSQKADYPFPTYAVSAFSIGMKGYVGCGVSAGNLFYAYDPIANTWSPITGPPNGSTDMNGFALNGKGYYLYSNLLYEYDPLLDLWTQKTDGPFGWSSWPSTFVIGDKAYVKAGYGLYEYKPSTNQWIARAPFPGLTDGGAASFAVNGKGYIVCGYIGWLSELSNEVWEFDPATNTWTLLAEFPGNGRRFSSGFAIGNKGYVGIGTTGTNMRDFWEFDKILTEEENEIFNLSIYPNPATEYVNVKMAVENFEDYKILLFQADGKLVYSSQILEQNTIIERNDLPAGTYIYSILKEDKAVRSGQLIFE